MLDGHPTKRFNERITKATQARLQTVMAKAPVAWSLWKGWAQHATDAANARCCSGTRLRQRGNTDPAHAKAGKPPLPHFGCGRVMGARSFEQPVNCALVRIVPPKGVGVDETRRPCVIIDPRAGHGIGGFKDDSHWGPT